MASFAGNSKLRDQAFKRHLFGILDRVSFRLTAFTCTPKLGPRSQMVAELFRIDNGFTEGLFMINFIAQLLAKLKNRKQRKRVHRRLRMERMEVRTVMANDLGVISGTVFTDPTDDGFTSIPPDVAIQSATVQLYRDAGALNGIFDVGDTLVGTDTSDAAGFYEFDALIEGTYFVRQTAVSGQLQRPAQSSQTVTITAAEAAGAAGTTIDNFNTTVQSLIANSVTPTDNSSVITAVGETLGGERDVLVNYTAGPGGISAAVSGGILSVSPDAGTSGTAFVTLDGTDGDATTINNTNGLNNFDLTDGGNDIALNFRAGSEAGNTITIRVYSSSGDFSTYTTALPVTVGAVATESLTIRFADPAWVATGSGANFTSVNAIQFQINVVAAADAQFDFTQTVGPSTETINFANLNPMSLGDNVFRDVNNNGTKDGGETGISGVTVELYSDTNANGVYNSGVDTLVATDTTDGSGNYLFNDLLPGEYLVLIPISQFAVAQPLFGFESSLEPAVAPDADIIVVDGDDNGALIAGVGVASLAITLASGFEPTDDGDLDADSNLTLDFGFAPQIDLVVDKTANVTTINAGNNVTYTLAVRNDGPAAAANVMVVDDLPAGVTIVSATSSTGTVTQTGNAAGEVSVALGTLNAAATATITIVVTVPATADAGTITNLTTITGDGDETNPNNNNDSVDVDVTRLAVLTLTKTDTPDPVLVGGQLTYTMLVTNTGPSTATNVTVVDTLPAGLTFGTVATTAGTAVQVGGVITATIPTLAVNGTATVTVVSTVLASFAGTTIANSATADADEASPVTANANTAVNPQVDLAITKTDSADPVNRGSQVTYTLDVVNNGPSGATNVVVADTLPAGLTFVSATGGTVTAPVGGNQLVSVAVGNLASGGTATVTIVATVDQSAAALLTNTATVTSTESTAGFDTNTLNNSDTETTATQGTIDLVVTKSDSVDPAAPGNTLTYTILVTNNGPSDATLVTLSDNLPDGIQITSATSTVGTVTIPASAQDTTAANTDDLSVNIGNLANGATATITVVATILGATRGTLSNVATAVSGNTSLTDSNPANNSDTETTVLTPSIDLAVTKTDSADPAIAGNQLTYTIVVTNNGPSQATNVSLTDTLPAGVTFVSGTSTTGATVTASALASGLDLGTLNSGATATVTILVGIAGATRGIITNSTTVTATEAESNAANNTATATTAINGSVDVGIVKTDSADPAVAGGTLTYTITVTNNGPSTATNVVVTDPLPTGLTFTSGTSTNGGTVTNAANTVTATIPTLASGASATITVVTAVSSTATGTLTNTATVDTTEVDAVTSNDSSTQTTAIAVPTSISGKVYRDIDRDNVQDAGELGLQGIVVTLVGTDVLAAAVNRTATTNANGEYSFNNVLPGTYSVSRPANLGDGTTSPGTSGGTAGTTSITNITLGNAPATSNNLAIASSPFSKRRFLASTPANLI